MKKEPAKERFPFCVENTGLFLQRMEGGLLSVYAEKKKMGEDGPRAILSHSAIGAGLFYNYKALKYFVGVKPIFSLNTLE